jgi:hypothetical protein
MNDIEEKWIEPGRFCNLCNRRRRDDERWWDTHTNTGCSGFTFNFCTECEKDRDPECVEVMSKVLSDHIKKVREYWDTHPEELAESNRKTAEYRKTLDVDGYPKEWQRTRWQKFRNFVWRMLGYSMYDKNGYLTPGNWERYR